MVNRTPRVIKYLKAAVLLPQPFSSWRSFRDVRPGPFSEGLPLEDKDVAAHFVTPQAFAQNIIDPAGKQENYYPPDTNDLPR
jgi:hypothetical protein